MLLYWLIPFYAVYDVIRSGKSNILILPLLRFAVSAALFIQLLHGLQKRIMLKILSMVEHVWLCEYVSVRLFQVIINEIQLYNSSLKVKLSNNLSSVH